MNLIKRNYRENHTMTWAYRVHWQQSGVGVGAEEVVRGCGGGNCRCLSNLELQSWELSNLLGHHTHLYRFRAFLFSCSVKLSTCPGLPWPHPTPVACSPFPSVHSAHAQPLARLFVNIPQTLFHFASHVLEPRWQSIAPCRRHKRFSFNVPTFTTPWRKWKCDLILISPLKQFSSRLPLCLKVNERFISNVFLKDNSHEWYMI